MSNFFSILFLAALAAYILKLCTKLYLQNKSITYEILVLVFFAIFYPLSGIAHLGFPENAYRGFFDTVNYKTLDRSDHLNLMAVLTTYIAAAGLILGLRPIKARSTPLQVYTHPTKNYLKRTRRFGVLLTAASLVASLVIFKNIDVTTIERSRSLETGIAKFIFISTWLGWGLGYIYTAQLKADKLKSPIAITLSFLIIIFFISANVAWTGGRSIVFVLALPLIMVVLRMKKNIHRYILPPYFVALFFYVVWITLIRTEGFDSYNISLSTLLDWEFGRYSMIGYAVDYVERNDYLYGSTLLSAFMSILSGPLHLIGLRDLWSPDQSLIAIIGSDILGSKSLTYIVPGLVAEVYMNFGIFGVFFSLLLVGKFVATIDCKLSASITSSVHKPLLLSYIGTLICLQLLNATFQAFLSYLFFTGFPLLFACILLRSKKTNMQKTLRPRPLFRR